MLKQEFEALAKVSVSCAVYAQVEKAYMDSNLDKQAFCASDEVKDIIASATSQADMLQILEKAALEKRIEKLERDKEELRRFLDLERILRGYDHQKFTQVQTAISTLAENLTTISNYRLN